MDALAIFFETASPDKDDACKAGNPRQMRITCEFDQLPEKLVMDADYPTTLSDEYLLTPNGTLLIQKTYNGSLGTPKITAIDALAEHPTAEGYSDLLTLKKAELARRATDLNVDLDGVDRRANALVRAAIWQSCVDLRLATIAVPLDAEESKQVWAEFVRHQSI